jgi:hypothetical protein
MTPANFLGATMLSAIALLPGVLRAETITLEKPIACASLHTGGVDLAVYYVDRGDHFEVVGTYAPHDLTAEPARFRMALHDGDGAGFGLPGMATAVLYKFSRTGSAVEVEATYVGEGFAALVE